MILKWINRMVEPELISIFILLLGSVIFSEIINKLESIGYDL